MATTLCVVDVQPKFSSSKKIVNSVVDQIHKAKRRGDGIIILEYEGYGKSDKKVYKALGDYKKHVVMKKCTDDGSYETLDAMTADPDNFSFNRIRICGVNACYCVYQTALGLKSSGYFDRVEVASSATSCSHNLAESECVSSLIKAVKKCPR